MGGEQRENVFEQDAFLGQGNQQRVREENILETTFGKSG